MYNKKSRQQIHSHRKKEREIKTRKHRHYDTVVLLNDSMVRLAVKAGMHLN